MKNTGTLKVTTPSDREIVLTRVFDAPRSLVFDALTKPELLKRWFGPRGWSLVVCEVDLKVGGAWRYVLRGPTGADMVMRGVYREIAPPERSVHTESFDDFPGESVVTTVLVEDRGRTTLTGTILYPSKEIRDAVIQSGMEHGAAECHDKLAELLASSSTRKTGEFCWINMLTPRPAEARVFFGALLGWTYVEMPGIGHRVQVGGRDVGGLFDLESPNTPPGTPPLIGVMVKVDSADATRERVTSLGGQAKPAFDVMDAGRMAVCFDPNGAQFDAWEPKKLHGTDVDGAQHGAPSWFETLTTDVDRAAKFYSGLFGWTPEAMSTPGLPYTHFKMGAAPVAGMLQITPQMGKMRPCWWTYFTVNDADEAARKAVELGATICMTMKEVPGVGRFCAMTSPQGVTFYVIQYTR